MNGAVNLLRDVPLRDGDGNVRVVVEVPAGSRVKLKYDADLNLFVWSRGLSLGVCFPYDFGFLPRTLAEDGDALDAFVYADVPSHPGVVVPGRVLGALRVEQQRDAQPAKRNDRMLVVPLHAHRKEALSDISHLPTRVRNEIEEFFRASLVLTGKNVRFLGWADAAEAGEILARAEERYAARGDAG